MNRRAIHTDLAPAAIGPYQQGIRVGDFVFTSGQIALDPATGEFQSGTIEEETELTIKNLQAILSAEGLTLEQVVKCNVYLADMTHFSKMNGVYEKFFSGSKPARACVQVAALPKGALVEIDVVAVATQ